MLFIDIITYAEIKNHIVEIEWEKYSLQQTTKLREIN